MAGRTGRNGNAQKNYYAAYKSKAEKNRKARLERHQKRHPNDKQGGSTTYRKVTPKDVSGWLTPKMDSLLTPTQTTPIVDKKTKQEFIPECAQPLREMSKAERKQFAKLYARVRKIHNHPKSKTKSKTD